MNYQCLFEVINRDTMTASVVAAFFPYLVQMFALKQYFKAHSKPSYTSKMEIFLKIVNG